eukprot:13687500-Alexandrium_andersonii.AAC.1
MFRRACAAVLQAGTGNPSSRSLATTLELPLDLRIAQKVLRARSPELSWDPVDCADLESNGALPQSAVPAAPALHRRVRSFAVR